MGDDNLIGVLHVTQQINKSNAIQSAFGLETETKLDNNSWYLDNKR